MRMPKLPTPPLWQRLNLVLFTLAGGYIGLKVQAHYHDKYKLREETLPHLESTLSTTRARRHLLEAQLENAQNNPDV